MLKRFAWTALFACAPLYAAPHLDDQRLQQLANDPFWLSLGHYEAGKISGWRSYVSEQKFFLAADGAHHPDAELKATVEALYAPASLGEKHVQCVYPARTRWLKDQLQLADLPAVDCKEFKQWFKDVAPHSAVMIFPAAYPTARRRCSATPCCASTRPTCKATTPLCSATRSTSALI